MAKKEKLITHTGGHKKVVINLEVAKDTLDEVTFKALNQVLIGLNDIQERRERG